MPKADWSLACSRGVWMGRIFGQREIFYKKGNSSLLSSPPPILEKASRQVTVKGKWSSHNKDSGPEENEKFRGKRSVKGIGVWGGGLEERIRGVGMGFSDIPLRIYQFLNCTVHMPPQK